jgi:antitoxin YefM
MALEITYTALRKNLARVLDQVLDDRETVIVRRRNGAEVALISASELAGIVKVASGRKAPRNAERPSVALD